MCALFLSSTLYHWQDSQHSADVHGWCVTNLTMLRRTMPTLEALALRKPGHEKVTSLRDDIAQPPMMGSSDAQTASGGYEVPRSGADRSTENTWNPGPPPSESAPMSPKHQGCMHGPTLAPSAPALRT